ncbi:MAG: TolC family protein [Gammaproteobacteria bacterium]|nr:MAG: TolC family protein [Gammaproteobacteria bacterium]
MPPAAFYLLVLLMPLALSPARAAPPPWTEPLTLGQALARAEAPVPEMLAADAEVNAARAEVQAADSRTGLRVDVEGRLRLGAPLDPAFSRNDSALALVLRRRLTDFGRTPAARRAGAADLEAARLERRWARWQRRLAILDAYLEVLEADQDYQVEDEHLAVLFVRLDALRDRHRLGQVSDVALLELESRYQHARVAHRRADARRRLARARLAEALGTPGVLPGELAPVPDPEAALSPLPPLETLEREVMTHHPRLRALEARLRAAEARVAQAAATAHPELSLEAGAGAYARDFGGRNRWHAGVVLSLPLETGGVRDAALARARAARDRARAALEALRRRVRLELRTLVEEIGILQAREKAAAAGLEYRDLDLERSRARYELELQTDLGDAMVELEKAQRERDRVRDDLLRALARLDALRGREPLAEVVQ